MANKNFKVKNNVQVSDLNTAGAVTVDANGVLQSSSALPVAQGGTGQTTAQNAINALVPSQTSNANKLLGTDGTSVSWVSPGIAYQTSAPLNPVTGQLWVDSDETGDSLDPYIIRRKTITATAGQTVFTTDVTFTDGYEQVYYNGVLLVRTTDYTTSGGTNTVTLLQGTSAGDTIEIIASTPINLVNAVVTGAANTITASSATTIPLTVQGAASQTANLFEVKNNAGELRYFVDINGTPHSRAYGPDSTSGFMSERYNTGDPVATLSMRGYAGTIASPAAVGADQRIGLIGISGYDGTSLVNSSRITFSTDGPVSTGNIPGRITFNTAPVGGSHTERMRIDSNGQVGIGPIVAGTFNKGLSINSEGGQYAGILLVNNSTGTSNSDGTGLFISNSDFIINNREAANVSIATSGVERVRISSAGNLAIGDDVTQISQFPTGTTAERGIEISTASNQSSPTLRFHRPGQTEYKMGAYGTNNHLYITNNNGPSNLGSNTNGIVITNSTGYALFGYSSSNGAYRVQVNSQIFATSSSIATSDGRYKEEVNDIANGLAIIDSLRPVSFKWKEHPVHNFVAGKTVGFIAQEVQEALSDYEWVDNIIKTNYNDETEEEFLGIAESNIIPLLVAAVKELKADFEEYKRTHP